MISFVCMLSMSPSTRPGVCNHWGSGILLASGLSLGRKRFIEKQKSNTDEWQSPRPLDFLTRFIIPVGGNIMYHHMCFSGVPSPDILV